MGRMTKLKFITSLPQLPRKQSLIIYDQRLRPYLKTWLLSYPNTYAVRAGEGLKDVNSFPEHLRKILALTKGVGPTKLTVVALGGGSVGDFAGFVASVLKRGVPLVHIPSTWLAAIDSSHGGKTALNVNGIKNQIGTFYPAEKIYLVKSLLLAQPQARSQEAIGEALKMALLAGGPLWRALRNTQKPSSKMLWSLLPKLIREKYKIVKRDPFEKKGYRHLLNLGHTVGHVFEAELGLPHGIAVLHGLRFAIDWSFHYGLMSKDVHRKLIGVLPEIGQSLQSLRSAKSYLAQDKKMLADAKLRFVFLRTPGRPQIRTVTVKEVLSEMSRQKRKSVERL